MVTTENQTTLTNEWKGIWSVLGCKWTFHVVRHLAGGDAHFNEIVRAINGLASSTLSRRLDCLQDEDLVSRTVEDGSPPGVIYSLTEKGTALAGIIDEIENLEKQYQ